VKVLATYNIKGGVGKTATAVNLAYLAAREGAPTLVWDLDPQGAASFYFRIKPRIKGGGERLVTGKRELEDCIRGTDFADLDLLPADFSYRNMDLVLEQAKNPARRLHRLLEPLAGEYDYVFLDCPPSISLVSENVFYAADAVLVPTIPTPLSLRTFRQIRKFLATRQDLAALKVLPFFAMADRRKQLHREILDNPPDYLAGLLGTAIPYTSEVERMGIFRAPLGSFAGRSWAAQCYENLWADVKRRLEGSGAESPP
jgi:cellulose biosynthesis protein BcsQ